MVELLVTLHGWAAGLLQCWVCLLACLLQHLELHSQCARAACQVLVCLLVCCSMLELYSLCFYGINHNVAYSRSLWLGTFGRRSCGVAQLLVFAMYQGS